jgi:hypothetical protein
LSDLLLTPGAGLYVMIHVGSQSLSDAVAMAQHAQGIGADGIAVIPPYDPSFTVRCVDWIGLDWIGLDLGGVFFFVFAWSILSSFPLELSFLPAFPMPC